MFLSISAAGVCTSRSISRRAPPCLAEMLVPVVYISRLGILLDRL